MFKGNHNLSDKRGKKIAELVARADVGLEE
jgi:hypothetical protein